MRRLSTPLLLYLHLLAPLLLACSAPSGLDGVWRVSSIAEQRYPQLSDYGTTTIERSWAMELSAPEDAPDATGTMTWRERYLFHGGGEQQDVSREFSVELRDLGDGSFELMSWPEPGGDAEPLPPQLICSFVGEQQTAPLRCVDERAREWLWERD